MLPYRVHDPNWKTCTRADAIDLLSRGCVVNVCPNGGFGAGIFCGTGHRFYLTGTNRWFDAAEEAVAEAEQTVVQRQGSKADAQAEKLEVRDAD